MSTFPIKPVRWWRLLPAVVVAAVVTMTAGGPAYAHNSLVSTSPADGATVPATPAQIVLTFDQHAIPMGTQLVVTGPAGPVQAGPPRLIDTNVIQDLEPGAPAGDYTVDWRVTSADGHPITGSFRFTSINPGPGVPPVADAGTAPVADERPTPILRSVLTAVVVLGIAAIIVFVIRRRRGTDPTGA